MQIEVRLFAVLAERAGAASVQVEFTGGELTMAELKRLVMEQHPKVGQLGFSSGVVGTSYVADDAVIDLASELALLPPVSGGQPEALEAGVFELSSEPIDPGSLGARVAHATCGATVVFTGTTRNRNRGQIVEQLDYEAFDAMAGPEMSRIFERCLKSFGPPAASADEDRRQRVLRMLCVHRTGTVPVGEPSVVIAVSSPHRNAAFDAARFLIDELKQSLPVWKQEHYQDGHHWIGDRS